MSKVRVMRSERELVDYARAQGFNDIEIVCGKKHRKLHLEGRMVAVFSYGKNDGGDKGAKNLFALIKKIAKEKQ